MQLYLYLREWLKHLSMQFELVHEFTRSVSKLPSKLYYLHFKWCVHGMCGLLHLMGKFLSL